LFSFEVFQGNDTCFLGEMKMEMLQLLVFAAFFMTVAEAGTALQTFCATLGGRAIYNGTSCYVFHPVAISYPIVKNSCNDILGYYGHLVFIKNSGVLSVVYNLAVVSFVFANRCEVHLNGAQTLS
jgi:hypothetical protein